jgi:hypothetical protein
VEIVGLTEDEVSRCTGARKTGSTEVIEIKKKEGSIEIIEPPGIRLVAEDAWEL